MDVVGKSFCYTEMHRAWHRDAPSVFVERLPEDSFVLNTALGKFYFYISPDCTGNPGIAETDYYTSDTAR